MDNRVSRRFETHRLSSHACIAPSLFSSSSTAPFENQMDEIIHLSNVGGVIWLVRLRNKFVLVVSVDLQAHWFLVKKTVFAAFIHELLFQKQFLQAFCKLFSFKNDFLRTKKVSRVNISSEMSLTIKIRPWWGSWVNSAGPLFCK